MNQGKLVQLGTPRDLYRHPADRFVAEFVGVSNVVPVELVESNANGATVLVFGRTIRSRRPPRNPENQISIVLRPEALRIEKAGGAGVPAQVLTMAFTGPIARYTNSSLKGSLLPCNYRPRSRDYLDRWSLASMKD